MEIDKVTAEAESKINQIASRIVKEKYWVTHYGANDIHPKHLVFWICVQSDVERDRLQSDQDLRRILRQVLVDVSYPIEGRDHVFIGFESQETVDRESDGHWWYHWK